ncbi:MAG: hypothetical protein MJ068_04535 [Clostridia bacterium]|nr:hypothetical protein [Clostridia bacterium]
MENERLDFINSLECKRIYPGDSSVLPALENFDCGDKEKYSYGVSSEMLKSFHCSQGDEVDAGSYRNDECKAC